MSRKLVDIYSETRQLGLSGKEFQPLCAVNASYLSLPNILGFPGEREGERVVEQATVGRLSDQTQYVLLFG